VPRPQLLARADNLRHSAVPPQTPLQPPPPAGSFAPPPPGFGPPAAAPPGPPASPPPVSRPRNWFGF